MRVSQLQIENFCGIVELDFEPGKQVTEISGANGVGKTSVVRALQALVGERLDVPVPLGQLARDGTKPASVGIVLSNGRRFARRWDAGKTTLEGFDEGGRPLKSVRAALRDVLDALVNPVDFLAAEPGKRAEWLIQASPLTVTSEELADAVGTKDRSAYRHLQQYHALVAIARLHDDVFKRRTEANSAAKAKRQSLEQLRPTLPPGEPRNMDGEVKALQEALATAEEALARLDFTASTMLADEERAAETEYSTARSELTAAAETRIRAIREQLAGDIDNARREADVRVATARAAKNVQCAAARPPLQAARDEAQDRLARQRAIRDLHMKAAGTRTLIADLEKDAALSEKEAARLTAGLENLKKMRLRLLAVMPVRGLELANDGQIYRDGVLFDLLNSAQQVTVAVEIAAQRAGKCGLICVDGLERLAPEYYEEFKRQLAESGLQAILTRVTAESGLNIRCDEEALAS